MIDRKKSFVRWRLAAVAAALAAVSAAIGGDYIHEDARIQGKEIHCFSDNGEDAMVVLGDFSLTLGQYVLGGRDAVVWIRSQPAGGGLSQYDMEVFIEGNATVTEPGGSTTNDKLMFITLRSMGRLRASGTMSPKPLADFPLYKRALATRQDAAGAATATATAPAELPALIISSTPAPKSALRVVRPATPIDVRKPRAPQPVMPVEFHTDHISSQEIGEGKDKRRVTVAHGNVYVSQGNPESELFLEMRSQTAVVFSVRRAAGEDGKKDTIVPYAPKMTGIETPGGGQEVVTGVYLSGDVVISFGSRYMRGPSAYYDFTTNRALMVEPVFRAVDVNREIPMYVRAAEARRLSDREVMFHKAVVTTSDFHTPSFALSAREAYIKNETPYDARGVRVGEQQWLTEVKDATFDVYGVPVAWTPGSKSDFSEGTTPLRRVSAGSHGRMGFGGEADWHLFRLLGLVEPKGVNAILETDWYERGPLAGIDLDYDRESYHGYSKAYGIIDQKQNDDFGAETRKDLYAPQNRGWLLTRHKQYLPNDWELQFELSYICDRNFLEAFFPNEQFTGKDQETLLYAKKQQDNWALTALLQYRLNRFQSQTESAPQFGFNLIGQSFADDKLTFFSENLAGINRFRPDNALKEDDSSFMARLDTREEVDWPSHLGPVNVVPYAVGRVTYWSDAPEAGFMGRPGEGANDREYGQLGIRSNMHFWRVYRDIHSRLWDLDGIKHVVTPEVVAFLGESASGVGPGDLYPMDPGVEGHLGRKSGVAMTLAQRLQTKRGEGENRRTVDWMRLDVTAAFFDGDGFDNPPSDGRFFFSRPEYSIARNSINYDYQWSISDSTTFLADGNYDTDRGVMGRWDFGVAVQRDPRLRYYLGIRGIEDLDSTISTIGATYQINEKYSVSGFLQYDYGSSQTLGSSLSLIRKFPRWYLGTTFVTDKRTGDLGLYFSVWPEGMPEVHIGSKRTALLNQSDLN
jgi:hypothetical protein